MLLLLLLFRHLVSARRLEFPAFPLVRPLLLFLSLSLDFHPRFSVRRLAEGAGAGPNLVLLRRGGALLRRQGGAHFCFPAAGARIRTGRGAIGRERRERRALPPEMRRLKIGKSAKLVRT